MIVRRLAMRAGIALCEWARGGQRRHACSDVEKALSIVVEASPGKWRASEIIDPSRTPAIAIVVVSGDGREVALLPVNEPGDLEKQRANAELIVSSRNGLVESLAEEEIVNSFLDSLRVA